ncbi:sodium/hydrogen exchanger 9B2 [Patella vulgata]|uniref:sodium/hydrogen exchanger 9B2 n=1 Tax=Patella vulgata TaxID=6465 RepID=UPI00217F5351|nr:sodium/hydrogen exchanger 9B2 [Patella vulgata]XP_050417680.1 sodium/hydrogen exchanger 9B2 [Patella vulgata]XP_050417681.1 sodium/hydrogen exchanger 9B2 [Patella vulgata]
MAANGDNEETKAIRDTLLKDNGDVINGLSSLQTFDECTRSEKSEGECESKSTGGCCGKIKNCFDKVSRPFTTAHNPLPDYPTLKDRFVYGLRCPPHGRAARWLVFILTIVILWAIVWSIVEEEALPYHSYFGMIILFPLCIIGGLNVQQIRLPPLLGMLLLGCLLRNVPVVNFAESIDKQWSSSLRAIALVIILIRAGLGLDPVALKKLSLVVLRLAALPCIFEALTVGVAAWGILGFPWSWAFMLGFIHSAVSPAVVVPSMLKLQEEKLGTNKGIPTMVIAAGSLDDVLAISGFGIALGIAFSQGDLTMTIIHGPIEAVVGLTFGLIYGVICWYLPNPNSSRVVFYRFALVFGGGLFSVFGSRTLELPGAGALACLTLAFVAAHGWRRHGWTGANPVTTLMGRLWQIFQPLLFGLIGAEVDITKVKVDLIGAGIGVLFIGLSVRVVVSFLVMYGTDLNLREKLFVPFAWLPKATVQAAVGSVALDTAREKGGDPELIELGTKVLAMAVLVIIITAPLGALAISITAPRLLTKEVLEINIEEGTPPDDIEEKKS